ncbi:MAG: hypothetical protein AAGI91_10910 [Bacteroidota bacterium]
MIRSALVLAILILLPVAGCDSGETIPQSDLAVTGFAITLETSPEVDPFFVCGRPARTAGLIAAVPNPYRGRSVYETGEGVRVLRFINLPNEVRIEIVRAYWHTVGPDPTSTAVGGSLAYVRGRTGETVRAFEKDSPSRSFDWDLRDARGDLVPSGFYRAFFTYGSRTVFDDLYVVQPEVSGDLFRTDDGEVSQVGDGSWFDPTGCL